MIHVIFTDEIVEISGHAGMAAAGQDIVCAAVSALGDTAASLLWEEPDARPGYLLLHWKKMDRAETHYIDFLAAGIRMIADAYPDNVTMDDYRETQTK